MSKIPIFVTYVIKVKLLIVNAHPLLTDDDKDIFSIESVDYMYIENMHLCTMIKFFFL